MTFGAVFPRALRPAFGPGLASAAAAANWWEAGGASGCVAAYQPKGAASLAASYTNLANPGTNNAAPGTAPTFDAATGWTFDGATQYLKSGIVDTATTSLALRFSGATITGTAQKVALGSSWCQMQAHDGSRGGARSYNHSSTFLLGSAANAAGVMVLTPDAGYFNGSSEGAIPSVTVLGRMITIGASGQNVAGSSVISYFAGNVLAAAIYTGTLTAPQVAAVSAAMAAL